MAKKVEVKRPKLTMDDLIKQKESIYRKKGVKKKMEIYLDQLQSTVTIEEPDSSLVTESIGIGSDENQESNGDDFLVYNTMIEPNLKDAELQKIYECKEPVDIVNAIFSPGTVSAIAVEAMKMAGYMDGITPVAKLKN